jgi:GDPmannose 4,6-dehydratase
MFACSGILFNHESPRRGFNFVTKKIVNGLEAVGAGRQECLTLGNLTALRDWGHAKDYVEAMWLMLQQDTPDDYVISTGEQYSVKHFVEKCAPYFAMKIRWEGEGLNEVGIDTITNRIVIRVDPKYFRPAEVQTLLGDSSKARRVLGWTPKHTFDNLVEDMCINFN